MNKYICLMMVLMAYLPFGQAQQDRYSWKVGIHGGFSAYYGDLSHQFFEVHHKMKAPFNNLDFWAYGLSVEHHVSKLFGIKLMGLKSQLVANDRTYDNSANYNRGLNFQTDIIDVSLLGTFYLDNGAIFGHKAVISPYFIFGAGLTFFDAKGDLLGTNGGHYYYWSDNTIRTADEASPNAASAKIVEQDGKYETSLRPLKTEGNNYEQFTWNVAAGMGFKFRLSQRFHLHLEALIKYTGSDYLDDVSGDYLPYYTDNFQGYAANPTNENRTQRGETPNMNDWYGFLGLSLHYSFGQKTYKIRPSIIYTPIVLVSDTLIKNQALTIVKDSLVTIEEEVLVIENKLQDSDSKTGNSTTTTITTTTTTTTNGGTSTTTKVVTEDKLTPTKIVKDSTKPIVIDSVKVEVNSVLLDSTNIVDSTFINKDTLVTKNSFNTSIYYPNTDSSLIIINNINIDGNAIQRTSSDTGAYLNKIHEMEMGTQKQKYEYELKLLKQDYESKLKIQKLENQLEMEKLKKVPTTSNSEFEIQKLKLEHDLKLQKQDFEYQLKMKTLEHALELEKLQNKKTSFIGTTQKDSTALVQVPLKVEKVSDVNSNPSRLPVFVDNENVEKKLDELLLSLTVQQRQLNDLATKKNNPSSEGTVVLNTENIDEKLEALLASLSKQQKQLDDLKLRSNDIAIANNPSRTDTKEIESRLDKLLVMLTEQQKKIDNLSNRDLGTSSTIDANNLALLQTQNNELKYNLVALDSMVEKLSQKQVDTIQILKLDSIYITLDSNEKNEALLQDFNRQKELSKELVNKLYQANTTINQQEVLIDSLSIKVSQLAADSKNQSSELEKFLSKQAPSYVTKIYFDPNKTGLTIQAEETLTILINQLKNYPEVRFLVKGFASKKGNTERNNQLSNERAKVVATYLESKGVELNKIKTASLGDSQSSDNTEIDRRAEVHLSF